MPTPSFRSAAITASCLMSGAVEVTGGDAEVDGGSVWVRAEKADRGGERSYVIAASATDVAGNVTEASGGCVVPHSQGG
ncbi:MAG TPA: hypothetical protein VFN44_04750 [Solirubrobacteraceae bacterium]|nr:hypothetical protein [Solirubrobacteraceae bacterium]